MPVETSVIIRTKNEEKWIGVVLKKLFSQTYKNFEVIIVDSGSTDRTLRIAKQFPIKVVIISPEYFSYPYALNFGIARANATRYIVILSAHSIPVSNTWLNDGIENFSKFPNVMGVYGHLKALPDATFWDKFFINGIYFLRSLFLRGKQHVVEKPAMGVLGFTNAIVRKDLWDRYHFNEKYGAGGEDGEWANYWFQNGYIIIKDIRFTVFHSHYLGLIGWHRQRKYWQASISPHPFRYLYFRKDKTHSN